MEDTETLNEVIPIIEEWRFYKEAETAREWLDYLKLDAIRNYDSRYISLIGVFDGQKYANGFPINTSLYSYPLAVELAEQMPDEFLKWWALRRLTQ